MEASVIDMANDVDKSCVCPICAQRFAWPLSMVDHVVTEHRPVRMGGEFDSEIIKAENGIFWKHSLDAGTYGFIKTSYKLSPAERVELLYRNLTEHEVVFDGSTTTIGGAC
jgi:hypothetical protein